MDRSRFLLTSVAGALGAPLAIEAQTAGKVAKIGYLTGSSLGPWVPSMHSSGGRVSTGTLRDETSRLRADQLREESSGFPLLPPNWLTSTSMCSW